MFFIDSNRNSKFFDLKSRNAVSAKDKSYADATVLCSCDFKKVLSSAEFAPGEGKEITAAEYQVLQTVFYPIWVVKVESDGEERVTYISDCGSEINLSIAYNQSMLEDVAKKVRRPRKIFWKLANVRFYLWSWLVIACICFAVGLALNIDLIVTGKAIKSTSLIAAVSIICVLFHLVVYYFANNALAINSETDSLIDSLNIGEKKAELCWFLLAISVTVIPIITTAAVVIIDKL